jgi:protein-disulfide isomerase
MIKTFMIAIISTFSCLANASTVDTLFHKANDPVGGNPKGSVTLVEFFDYQCSHCANMVTAINDVIKKNPNLRVVFKELPIRGPMSEYAARAALAANKQGQYMAFNHALFDNSGDLTESSITDIAKKLGLNMTQFNADMNSKAITDQIQGNLKFAEFLGIPGTPALFIGKSDASDISNIQYIPGEINETALQNAINQAAK